MKIISNDHFNEMIQICRYLETQSHDSNDYLSEFEAAKTINKLIQSTEDPGEQDFENIIAILNRVDQTYHANGSGWLDYKMHVLGTLNKNGYKP